MKFIGKVLIPFSLADTPGALARDLQFGRIPRMIRAAAGETHPEDETCKKQ